MTTTQTRVTAKEIVEIAYSRLSRLNIPKNVHMTGQAQMRVGCIVGWITGLYHAGKEQYADEAANQFDLMLRRLDRGDTTVSGVKVPSIKYSLSDDMCFNSFNFVALFPVAAETWNKAYSERFEQLDAEAKQNFNHIQKLTDSVNKSLKIIETYESQELTEKRWNADTNAWVKIRYATGFNGGIVYHGPGAGETFTVRVGDNAAWWGMHT